MNKIYFFIGCIALIFYNVAGDSEYSPASEEDFGIWTGAKITCIVSSVFLMIGSGLGYFVEHV